MARRASAAQAGDSVAAARRSAREARDQLQAGIDAIDDRERRRGAAQQADVDRKAKQTRDHLTLARAARDYHERAVEPRMTAKHGADWIASLENHVPKEIWNTSITTITAPQLLAALSTVRSVEEQ